MAISLNQTMRPAEIDVINNVNNLLNVESAKNTLLFNGTISKGSTKTVSNLDKYCLLAIYLSGIDVPILCYYGKNRTRIRGVSGYVASSGNIYEQFVYFDVDSTDKTKITLVNGGYRQNYGSSTTEASVSDIYGII